MKIKIIFCSRSEAALDFLCAGSALTVEELYIKLNKLLNRTRVWFRETFFVPSFCRNLTSPIMSMKGQSGSDEAARF